MPYPTPAYPLDVSRLDAFRRAASRMTPHAPLPAVPPPPTVFGGVLRSDSPFLDVVPSAGVSEAGEPEAGEPGDAAREPLDSHDGSSDAASEHPPSDRTSASSAPASEPLAFGDDLGLLPFEPVAPDPLGARMLGASMPGASMLGTPTREPSAPVAPFDRAAVARACARAARGRERVEATVMSDDGVAEHICDVTEWLAGATAHELGMLARAGWTGDEAADVADVLADDDPEVADVLRHARRTDAGVVVEIDGPAVLAWLARHRPSVAAALAAALGEPVGEPVGEPASDSDEVLDED